MTRNSLLELVGEGKIKPFTGSGQQSIFRASDVERLAGELQADSQRLIDQAAEAAPPEGEENASEPAASSGRRRRRVPIKLMGTRLSTDSRWAEMTDQDIEVWLDALEPVQFERVRKVCGIAIERLQHVLGRLDEQEAKLKSRPTGGSEVKR